MHPYASVSLTIISKHLGFGSRSFLWSFILRPRWSFPKTPCEVHWKFVGRWEPQHLWTFLSWLSLTCKVIIVCPFRSFRKIKFRILYRSNKLPRLDFSKHHWNQWFNDNHPQFACWTGLWWLTWAGSWAFLGLLNTPQWSLSMLQGIKTVQIGVAKQHAKKDQTWNGDTISQS